MKHECEAVRGFIKRNSDPLGDAILHESVLKHHGSKIKFSVCLRTGHLADPTLEFNRIHTTPLGNFHIDDELITIDYCPFCGERLTNETED